MALQSSEAERQRFRQRRRRLGESRCAKPMADSGLRRSGTVCVSRPASCGKNWSIGGVVYPHQHRAFLVSRQYAAENPSRPSLSAKRRACLALASDLLGCLNDLIGHDAAGEPGLKLQQGLPRTPGLQHRRDARNAKRRLAASSGSVARRGRRPEP